MKLRGKIDIKQEPFADFLEVKTEDVENLKLLLNECHRDIKEEMYQGTSHGFITPTFKNFKDEPQEVAGTLFSIKANSHLKCYNYLGDTNSHLKCYTYSGDTNVKAGLLHTECDLPTVKSEHFNPLVDHTYSKLPENPETCSIEFISNPQCFSYFTDTSNIKEETVTLKAEMLHTECDLPTIKNENYPLDNYNSLDQSKNGFNNVTRQKFKKSLMMALQYETYRRFKTTV